MKIVFNCDIKFYKNKDLCNALKSVDFSELEVAPVLSENEDGSFSMEFDNNELVEVQFAINDEIIASGLENQNEVNETGKMLYWLYDEILIQSKQEQTDGV